MSNFFKGILAGIGNIVPGLSGGALLVIFGLYEKCLNAISKIFKDFKKSVIFLFPVFCGIIIGTLLFSNIISICIFNFPLATSIAFVGFMIGTLPSLFNEATKEGFKKTYLIPLAITFALGVILLFIDNSFSLKININFFSLIFIGFIIALSTFIPGISSTVLLTMLGFYETYLESINTLNLKILGPTILGLAIGGFILSKLISYLLKKYYGYTFFAIIGFVVATIPALLTTKIIFDYELLVGITIGIIAFVLTNFTTMKANKKSQ